MSRPITNLVRLRQKWGVSVLLWCVISTSSAFAQSVYLERKALLEGQQRETRNTIDQIAVQLQRSQSLLDVTLKEVDQQYRLATQLSRQIRLQEEKILAIEQEIAQSNQKIRLIEKDIAQLEKDIAGAIDHYKETLTYVYKSDLFKFNIVQSCLRFEPALLNLVGDGRDGASVWPIQL